jgi:selenoprotein W-related protein
MFSGRSGAKVELVKSSGGVFEITVNGKLGFSKKSTGRFPEDRELETLLAGG